jgi:hypothetical protein
MVVYKTDPKQLPPPDVQPWIVLYTRKIPAGTASDVGYVDTGVVYDPAFEYIVLNTSVTAATPDPTAAATMSCINIIARSLYGTYKPDGVNALAVTNGILFAMIPAQQSAAALLAAATWGAPEVKFDAAGQFWSKWTQDMAKDGHVAIARRRRYG